MKPTLFALAAFAIALPLAGCATQHKSMTPYDTDRNGSISGEEFSMIYKAEDSAAVFKKLDINQDGQLSQAELDGSNLKEAAASAGTAAPAATVPAYRQ